MALTKPFLAKYSRTGLSMPVEARSVGHDGDGGAVLPERVDEQAVENPVRGEWSVVALLPSENLLHVVGGPCEHPGLHAPWVVGERLVRGVVLNAVLAEAEHVLAGVGDIRLRDI